MPIYEYVCPACGHDFERIVRVGAAPPACPQCAHAQVEKKVSLAAFQLKGSGWYKDAYAGRDNKKPGASTESAPSGSAAEGTAAAKPAEAAAAAPAATPAPAAPVAPKPAAAKAAGST